VLLAEPDISKISDKNSQPTAAFRKKSLTSTAECHFLADNVCLWDEKNNGMPRKEMISLIMQLTGCTK